MPINELVQLVTQFGWPVVLVGFFVWLSWKRELVTTARMDKMTEFIQGDLHSIAKAATAAIQLSTAAIQSCERSHEKTSEDVRGMCTAIQETSGQVKDLVTAIKTGKDQ